MTLRRFFRSLLLLLGLVLSPLRAMAATAPMLVASVAGFAPTATTVARPVPVRQVEETVRREGREAPESTYDAVLVGYDDAPNPLGIGVARGGQGYDGSLEHAEWRDLLHDGVIYDASGVVPAAEGLSTAARAAQLADAVPAAQAGRITMAVGLTEDGSVLIGTSEPAGYLRPGVTLAPGETMVAGTGHAEADIIAHAQANGLQLLEVGATRPICPNCAALIEGAGATPVTPLKAP